MNDRRHFLATLAGSRGRPWRHRLAVLSVWSAGFSALVAGVPAVVFAVQGPASVTQAAGPAAGLDVVPKPVSARIGSGHFTLTPRARIGAAPARSARAHDLHAYLRPTTGYPLPAV